MTAATESGPAARVAERVQQARRGLDPDERRRVMDAVALRTGEGWFTRFGLMQALSVVVAVMGLSAGSAAVVIGAMLLAPLMTPVMGVAAAISMALPRHLLRSLAVVSVASVASIALAFVLALFLPDVVLSDEVLSRTSPDLRDLMVALAAGAAGAYATVRPDVSNSLPGVAVAVALVPPLGTIGVTLEAGRGDLVGGALLLYTANLLAIVLIATGVLVATGFVPRSRFARTRSSVLGAGALVGIATLLVAIPLGLASVTAAEAGVERQRVYAIVEGWMAPTGNDLDEVRVDDGLVRVRMTGPVAPPPVAPLESSIRDVMGEGAKIEVRWTQTQAPVDPEIASGNERSEEAIRIIVDQWLAAGEVTAYEIEKLDLRDDAIDLHLASATPPPSVDQLSARLVIGLQVTLPVEVTWTQRSVLRSGASDAIGQAERALRLTVDDWSVQHPEFSVEDVSYDGDRIVVDLLGPGQVSVDDLHASLRALVGDDVRIDIYLTQRQRLTTTTTVPPPPTEPPPA